jgi:uncharacterized protein (DUF983 family)
MAGVSRPPFRTMLRRALARRCPVCGEGSIFLTRTRLRPSCPACGWIPEREPGTFTGPMYLIAVVTEFLAVGLAALLWATTDASPWLLVALFAPLLAVASLLAYGPTKAVWCAVEFFTDHLSGDARAPGYRDRAFLRDPSRNETRPPPPSR